MITSIQLFKESLNSTITAYHGGTLIGTLQPPIFLAVDINEADHYVIHADNPDITSLFEIKFTSNKIFKIRTKQDCVNFFDIIRSAGFPIEIEEKQGYWEVPDKYTEPIRKHSRHDGRNYNDWCYVPKVRNKLLELGYDTISSIDDQSWKDIEIYILLNPNGQIKSMNKLK